MTQPVRDRSERVPFADLSLQWRQIQAEALPDLDKLFAESAFCLGPWVERFEKMVAEYLAVPHAVGVNSGTSALHLALIAAGIGAGDHVLLPANTFIATAWAVLYVGAIPILCDVDPESWTIDVADAARRLTPRTRAIMPVHLYGQPADMDAVSEFARAHGLVVIEDAAQAIGAFFGGRKLGSHSPFACFSFYPGKNLGAAGEGGLITTADEQQAQRLRRLRHHAQTERYVHGELGFNYRMEGIQALILLHKLPRITAWTDERRRIAQRYLAGLAATPLRLPAIVNGDHVWHLFVVHTPERDRLRAYLDESGIDTGLHYPIPLHRQPALSHLPFDPSGYEMAERNARECLSLPIFVGMTEVQVDRVIAAVRAFYRI
ncbi:MAG TPA: DegT/DnrJ/EryC1/StrS family aminotransferase [Stellaceae bacterium]|nr:DegT/DnrJ/EryC1/StrS family aminotransferase [Stellaceae bacterium]